MTPIKVLSVDWDYFFPDIEGYHWDHIENPVFMEQIWPIRCNDRNLRTGASVLDEMVPTLMNDFWERVVFDKPKFMVVAESHADLFRVLENHGRSFDIVNYDAHHDSGYDRIEPVVDCGNWAEMLRRMGRLSSYTVHYPLWRMENPEDAPLCEGVRMEFGVQSTPDLYSIVFVCRSSAWCPSWCDDKWLEFVGWWWGRYPDVYALRNSCSFVQRERHPTLEEARIIAADFEKYRKSFTAGGKSNDRKV